MSLILSRKYSESIVCTTPSGERITITVQEIRGDKVRLRLDAQREVTVNRGEIQEGIDYVRNSD